MIVYIRIPMYVELHQASGQNSCFKTAYEYSRNYEYVHFIFKYGNNNYKYSSIFIFTMLIFKFQEFPTSLTKFLGALAPALSRAD